MSVKDMSYRRQRDLLFVSTHPSSQWTRNILSDLDLQVEAPQTSSLQRNNSHQNNLTGMNGITSSIAKSRSIKKYPDPLPPLERILEAYNAAERYVDYLL
jgi:hypothetical protein